MFLLRDRKVFAVLLLTSGGAIAQTQTSPFDPTKYPNMDAGALTRQAEQSYRAATAQRALSKLPAIAPPLVLPVGTMVRVQKFEFIGVHLIQKELLESASRPFVNRDLAQSDLDNLCSALTDAYRQTGWVVRVYVPHQALHADSLTLQILESLPPSSLK